MKGTKTTFLIFIFFSFVLLQGCSVPFANGITGRDVISSINTVRNLDKISKPGVKEEVITEAKNILQSIQHGGKVQR
jgi:hypothetical protein|tara:strand:- start:668 stop:898 length:231 start_codon:yes stop_codon:yes gene_type:complete